MEERIFYFEDELWDAMKFARLIGRIYQDAGCATEMEKGEIRNFLARHGIYWYANYAEAMRGIDQGQIRYQLFILDIMVGHERRSGLELIYAIRHRLWYHRTEIFVLSSFSHFEERALKTYLANRFYSKAHMEEMYRDLKEYLLYKEEGNGTDHRTLMVKDGKRVKKLDVDNVILIRSDQDAYIVYTFAPDEMEPDEDIFYEKSRLLKIVEDEDRHLEIRQFLTIHRGCLIHINMVEKTKNEDGKWYVKMRQVPDWLPVGREYRASVKRVFGEEVFKK